MDIVGGLTAANLALGLVKDLREIDRSVDEATFKLKVAELTSALADTKIALSDANLMVNEKKQAVQELEALLAQATKGDLCPKCRNGRMQLVKTKRHQFGGLGNFGVEDWIYTCDQPACAFEQTIIQDPQGLIAKSVAKRR